MKKSLAKRRKRRGARTTSGPRDGLSSQHRIDVHRNVRTRCLSSATDATYPTSIRAHDNIHGTRKGAVRVIAGQRTHTCRALDGAVRIATDIASTFETRDGHRFVEAYNTGITRSEALFEGVRRQATTSSVTAIGWVGPRRLLTETYAAVPAARRRARRGSHRTGAQIAVVSKARQGRAAVVGVRCAIEDIHGVPCRSVGDRHVHDCGVARRGRKELDVRGRAADEHHTTDKSGSNHGERLERSGAGSVCSVVDKRERGRGSRGNVTESPQTPPFMKLFMCLAKRCPRLPCRTEAPRGIRAPPSL